MHETDAPEADEVEPAESPEDQAPPHAESDPVLDGFESDLNDVASALDALDAEDLDRAEALVDGLGESPDSDQLADDQTH